MPGLFGGIGLDIDKYKSLKFDFESIWGNCKYFSFPAGFMGAHSFADTSAMHINKKGLYFVVDGEASTYSYLSQIATNEQPDFFKITSDRIKLDANFKGNISLWDTKNQTLYLATDWTGIFPLYYAQLNDTFLFSSLIKPLSKTINAQPDPLGIIQFMRFAFIIGGRTHFKGINRLLPGQEIVYRLRDNCLKIYENSRAWVGCIKENNNILIERYWNTLKNATHRCIMPQQKIALMSSAGWDSRLLLAGFREHLDTSSLIGYTHGDINSRELKITHRIYKDNNIKVHLEQINNAMYDIMSLHEGFNKVENMIFPYWYHAGSRLAEMGLNSVSAGVFGEIIGGHYGKSMFMSNLGKMLYILYSFLGKMGSKKYYDNNELAVVYDLLLFKKITKPWYVSQDYWASLSNIKENINHDIENTLKKIEKRGVKNADQLIEAYVTESRGVQYIGAQLIACRANLDISNIYGDQELFILGSQIPITIKIHNIFNQAVMSKYANDLLHYPTSAILTSAKAPIVLQELSRAVMKIHKRLSLKLKIYTMLCPQQESLGWDNFEFLRNGEVLQSLLSDFQSDILDKDAIQKLINRIIMGEVNEPLFNVANQFMKIFTTDLLLRS